MMSMQEKLPNGATVNRIWSDNKTELLGIFQYSDDAEQFAIRKIEQDAERKWFESRYVVACTYSGRIKIFAPTKPEAVAA